MARRRHLLNPAKVKADYKAIEDPPKDPTLADRFGLHRRATVAMLNLLTAVVLAISFPLVAHWPISGEWYLAYVALVPWTLALAGGCPRRWVLVWSFIGALAFWATMYWLAPVTLVGYFALIVVCSAFWLAAAVVVRSALRRGWPMWIVLPVVWVALEYARAYTMTGYTWYNLSLTQYARVGLIQIADLTGHYGVSFFVAMVNGAIVDVCLWPRRGGARPELKPARRILIATGAALGMLGVLVSYGAWRVSQSEQTTTPGPVIGIVQHDFPIALSSPGAPPRQLMNSHVRLTRTSLKGTGCKVVFWPETMLPEWLNPEMLRADIDRMPAEKLRAMASMVLGRKAAVKYSEKILRRALKMHIQTPRPQEAVAGPYSARDYAEELAELAVEIECPLLVGGATGHPNPDPVDEWDHWVIRNSALWFEPVGEDRHLAAAQYAKRHPVPFSETVPFKHSWPWLHALLRKFVPPSMRQLDAGTECTRFELKRSGANGRPGGPPWRLAVVICFEGTFARRCRQAVMQDGEKAADILVNLSNDGWFVYKRGPNSYGASTEHMQHLAQYCFRAVENRVPVVRAVNTGISASIDSNGRVVATIKQFDGRTNVQGTLLLSGRSVGEKENSERTETAERVLVDERVSIYSVVGDVFAMVVAAAAAAMVLQMIWSSRRAGTKAKAR